MLRVFAKRLQQVTVATRDSAQTILVTKVLCDVSTDDF
jgi:hypothetical protein